MDRDLVYMLDILEAARLATSYVQCVDFEQFIENTQLQDSVIRRIEIIGEASRRVTEKTREAYPQIPWTEMVGMRNRMIHDYDDVDLKIVWDTLQLDFPHLIDLLAPLVPPEKD